VKETQLFNALRLRPTKMILFGEHLKDKHFMCSPFDSFFSRMAYKEAYLLTLNSQHRLNGQLKSLNENVFQLPIGRSSLITYADQSQTCDLLGKLIGKLVFFDLSYLREVGHVAQWKD